MLSDAQPGAMAAPRTGAPPLDYENLAEYLAALAYPARLELLDLLRFPQAVGEIRMTPRRMGGSPEGGGDRPAARTTVQAHLDKLADADLVRVEPGPDTDGRAVNKYVVNPQKLYAVMEDMRRLSVLHAGRGGTGDATGTLDSAVQGAQTKGPRLVLVHGVYEGKAFALTTGREWIIGRKRGLPIALDYDPWVSLENTVIREKEGRYLLSDHPQSKNGTFLNWGRLSAGIERELIPGAVVGVGRSLLVFAVD